MRGGEPAAAVPRFEVVRRRRDFKSIVPGTGHVRMWGDATRSSPTCAAASPQLPSLDLKSCAEGATSNRYAGQLFDGRQPGRDLRDAVVPERAHALRDRRALELLAARLRGGEAFQRLAHLEQLIDADPALVAGLVTARAA